MRAAFDRRGLFVLLVAAFSVEGKLWCRPGSSWYDGCNRIFCEGANRASSRNYCSSELDPSEFTCEDISYWQWNKCNWCSCVDGKAICSHNICPSGSDGLEYLQLRELKDTKYELDNMKCTMGSLWNDGCNACSCSDDYTPMCTYPDCYPKPDLSEYTCEVNSYWLTENDCNWCSCIDGKVFCTDAPCLPVGEKRRCSPGAWWDDGCNSCSCEGTKPKCTSNKCDSAPDPTKFKCKYGSYWLRDGCNWCACEKGLVVCSNTDCAKRDSQSSEVNPRLMRLGTKQEEHYQASEQLAVLLQHLDKDKICRHGPKENRWREGCNWCSCSSTGDKGCSKKSCSAADLKRLEGTRECEGLAVWKRKDEWCICVNGSAGCKKYDYDPPVREEL